MKSLKVLLLYGFLFFIMSGFAFAQTINVSLPSDTTGEPGASVTLPIRVGDLTGRNVIAYQGLITFNANVLSATGASSLGTLSDSMSQPTVNIDVAGQIQVGAFGTSALSGGGVLVNLNFDVVGQADDSTDLVFENFIFNSDDTLANTVDGKFTISGPSSVDLNSIPKVFVLKQNYPNPFNPKTTISFEIPSNWTAPVTLQILNLNGQTVTTLINGIMPPGSHSMVWDGKNASGEEISSGLYFYKIKSGDFLAVKKMLLTK